MPATDLEQIGTVRSTTMPGDIYLRVDLWLKPECFLKGAAKRISDNLRPILSKQQNHVNGFAPHAVPEPSPEGRVTGMVLGKAISVLEEHGGINREQSKPKRQPMLCIIAMRSKEGFHLPRPQPICTFQVATLTVGPCHYCWPADRPSTLTASIE